MHCLVYASVQLCIIKYISQFNKMQPTVALQISLSPAVTSISCISLLLVGLVYFVDFI